MEMKAMMMTKQVLDQEVEREKLFSNVVLSQRDFKTLNENANSTSNPSSRSGNRTRRKSRKVQNPLSTESEEGNIYGQQQAGDLPAYNVDASQSSANAAFAKFRMENPNLSEDDLLQSYGELSLSLAESTSLTLNISDAANPVDSSVLGIRWGGGGGGGRKERRTGGT